jgi:hypothetical protein
MKLARKAKKAKEAVEEEEGHDYEPLTEEEMREAIEQEAPKPTQQAKPKKPKAKKG